MTKDNTRPDPIEEMSDELYNQLFVEPENEISAKSSIRIALSKAKAEGAREERMKIANDLLNYRDERLNSVVNIEDIVKVLTNPNEQV